MKEYYVIKLFEGCCNTWSTMTGPLSKSKADEFWNGMTLNGTVASEPRHGSYYKIFKVRGDFE
jgi:hypothetical protein